VPVENRVDDLGELASVQLGRLPSALPEVRHDLAERGEQWIAKARWDVREDGPGGRRGQLALALAADHPLDGRDPGGRELVLLPSLPSPPGLLNLTDERRTPVLKRA
jgi:hypothetical protein